MKKTISKVALSLKVYIPESLKTIRRMHAGVIDQLPSFIKISDFLDAMAKSLHFAIENKLPYSEIEINNYHPDYLSWLRDRIFALENLEKICRETIYAEFGFSRMNDIDISHLNLDHEFISAVDQMLKGDISQLEETLSLNPKIVQTRSSFGHKAQLIHYLGSNGVEFYQQVVPSNLLDLLELLLKYGADPLATCFLYGSENDLTALIKSSAHPYAAGIDWDRYDRIMNIS